MFEALKEGHWPWTSSRLIWPSRSASCIHWRPAVDRGYAGLGIGVYDVMGRDEDRTTCVISAVARPLNLPLRAGTRSAVDQLLRGQVDDARHAAAVSNRGALRRAVCQQHQGVGFLNDGERVTGVRVRDLESGDEFDVRARQTINATGVWIDELQEMLGGRSQFRIRASKGIHLVVPRSRINSAAGVITRTEKSLLFVIPWGNGTGSSGQPTRTGS